MVSRNQAIALCRVSSLEQLLNNSLSHQKDNVIKAAERLDVTIPADGVWEGQASSKVGVNYSRKDLLQMFEYCKKHRAVKYLIVQEVDRFMRSPDEQTYWYVRFWYELEVKVWFADKPELNEDTHVASLLRYMEGWRAAGSNEERKNKSINGQTAAIKEGRYTSHPKPGYRKGTVAGIHVIDEIRGPALRSVLIRLANHTLTPSQAVVALNKSDFAKGRAPCKMDTFERIAKDPYNAGIIEVNKQVKGRNEFGQHEPLISKAQYYEVLKTMQGRKKFQAGPRKNGNPKYPLNNIATHRKCVDMKNRGRLVGFDHGNGHSAGLVYEKYRCRTPGCGKYWHREDLHNQILKTFKNRPITQEGIEAVLKALDFVWKQHEEDALQEIRQLEQKIRLAEESIANQVEAATDPSNASIKEDILRSIAGKKKVIATDKQELEKLHQAANNSKQDFLRFAYNFIDGMGEKFLDPSVSHANRLRCKQLIFPAGFWIDENDNVYTPEMSPLYRLASIKKDSPEAEKSILVRVRRL